MIKRISSDEYRHYSIPALDNEQQLKELKENADSIYGMGSKTDYGVNEEVKFMIPCS